VTVAEERNVRDLRALIADDYSDKQGLDRKAVENLIRLHVLRQQSIHLFARIREHRIPRSGSSVDGQRGGRPWPVGRWIALRWWV
jgi:hypothetical protein